MNQTPDTALRILHTNMLRGWGGQSNRILTESLAVARRGNHRVALAVPHGSELAHRAREAGLPVHDEFAFRGLAHPFSFWRDVRRLRVLLRSEPWDIVHLHGSPDTWAAAFALRGLTPRPAILRTRHNIFPIARHPLNAWLYGRTLDGLVVISSAIERQCRAIPFLAHKPTALIWSVPDLERFGKQPPGTREHIRRELEAAEQTPVILCAGRLRPEKGQEELLRAVPGVRGQVPDVKFWMAGEGSQRAEYEALARRLGIESSVRFLGFRADVPALMAAADVAAVPSRSEGLGTAALEALAAGVPVVATRVGGLVDFVYPGQTGELVPAGDVAALADTLARLLQDEPTRRRLGEAGRALIHAQFTEDALARRTLDFYHRMVSLRRTTSPRDSS
jgi:glycosyltransferase involved in cell wall biosynthesis